MDRGRGLALAVLATALVLANGCALISIRTETRDEPPVLYSATRFDAYLAVIGPLTCWPSVPASFRPSTPECILMVPLCLADGVVSIVGDTLLLPYDSYHRRRLEADREFWKGVFLGGVPLPTVEAMHRHLTRYSAETVAWHVESELARAEGVDGEFLHMVADMRMGMDSRSPMPQDPIWWPLIEGRNGEIESGSGFGPGMGSLELSAMGMGGFGEPALLIPGGMDDASAEQTGGTQECPIPADRGESDASSKLRAARLDRLIDAEIALAAIAGRFDASLAQLNRLLPYAKRQADVRLALVGNLSTPPDMIDSLLAKPSAEELRALACNSSISPEWAQRIARGEDEVAAVYLACSPTLTPELMADLDCRESSDARFSLAQRGDLPDSHARRYVRNRDWVAVTMMIQVGRADLPVDVLRKAASLYGAGHESCRREILNAMPRQRHTPPELLQLAWEEGALTIHDIRLRPNLPQYCFDGMATAVTRAKTFEPEAMTALVPKVGSASLQRMRERVATERTSAIARGDSKAVARCQELLVSIDARLKELRRN